MNKDKVSVFANVCPKCHEGRVFRNFFWINRNCSNCGFLFEKEEGYFMGPMIISYFATSFAAIPVLLLMVFKFDVEFAPAIIAACAVMLVLGPLFYRYSKLIWLHVETDVAEGMKEEHDRAKDILRKR